MKAESPAQSAAAPAVVFFSHYNARTGAPLALLSVLRWLKAHTSIRLEIVLCRPGELAKDFAECGSVHQKPRVPRLVAAILRRIGGEGLVEKLEARRLRRLVQRLRPALIYSNTITNTREVHAVAPLGVPLLCHVHEMEYWIRHELGLARAAATIPLTRRFVAAGTGVSDYLISGLQVDPGLIDVVRPWPFPGPRQARDVPRLRADMRRELGVDDATFVVGGCGTVDWRKGADLFVALAGRIAQQAPGKSFRFVWLGGPVAGPFVNQLQHDLARAGLAGTVSFIGPRSSPDGFFAALDAFAVTSREDCGPMVMMEAAEFHVPILCFEKTGGAPEFSADGAGLAVPYLDVPAMAAALLRLAGNADLRASLAAKALERVHREHDAETQCAKIHAAMVRAQPQLAAASRAQP